MIWIVHKVEPGKVVLWDGKTKDKHLDPCGLLTLDVTGHNYEPDDKVELLIRKVSDE